MKHFFIKFKNDIRYEKVMVLFLIGFSIVLSRLIMLGIFYHKTGNLSVYDFIQSLSKYDVGWYRSIITNGYPVSANNVGNGQASWAFFPLYPSIIWGIWKLTNIDIYILGFIVSNIFLFLAEYMGYKYLKFTRNNQFQGYLFIFFMSFGLYSFYFSILYTESLFLFLLISCLYYMKKKNFILMGVMGLFLSATRNTGIFFVFVVLVYCITEYITEYEKKSIFHFFKTMLLNEKLVLGTMLIPAGFFSYVLYLKFKVGDGFAFVHVQRAWGKKDLGIISNLPNAILKVFPPDYLGVCFIVAAILISLLIFKYKRFDEATLALITLGLSSVSSFLSIPRYMIGTFAVVTVFTDEFINLNKSHKIIVITFIFIFEILLINAWLNSSILMI